MKSIEQFISYLFATKKNRFMLFFFVLIILSLLSTYLLDPISRGIDFHFHLRRFTSLIDALKDGNLISYLDYNALGGYGYMSNTFYPDLTLIPFALVGIFTGPVFAYKFALFTMSILCGYFTYRTVDIIFKSPLAGYIAAILYTFCSYRLFDYFHRSALGEIFTFTFVPIIILGLYYIINGNYKKWYLITIGFSLMIFSHAVSSLLMSIAVILILLFNIRKLIKEPKRIVYLVIAGFATILITSYYIFPMLEQSLSTRFYFNTHTWYTANNFRLGIYWLICGMTTGPTYLDLIEPPKLGLLLTFVICLRVFVKKVANSNNTELKIADKFVIIAFILLFMVSKAFPWSVFPFNKLGFIQFPWRLFEFISFFFAVAGGYYISQIAVPKKQLLILAMGLAFYAGFVIVSDSKVVKESFAEPMFVDYQTNEPNLANHYLGSGREYLPAKIKSPEELLSQRKDSVKSASEKVEISSLNRNKGVLSFDITAANADVLELPLIYYKGYDITLNGKELPVTESENGLINIPVDQSGRIEAYYAGTIIQTISFCITALSIIALCIYIYISRKRRKRILIGLG